MTNAIVKKYRYNYNLFIKILAGTKIFTGKSILDKEKRGIKI